MNQEDNYWSERSCGEQHNRNYIHQSELNLLVEKQEINLFSILEPKISIDGNQWCVLYGENLQDGVAGFGNTLMLAIYDFNKSFFTPIAVKV